METHGYVDSKDGTRIYYHCFNSAGSKPLILCDGIGCYGYVWKYMIPHFESDHRIIHWHYRGHGKSASPVDFNAVSIEHLAQDLDAVLEATQADQYMLIGHSMGVQVALHHGLTRPDKLAGSILVCGSHGFPLKHFNDSRLLEMVFPTLKKMVVSHPTMTQLIWSFALPTRLARYISEMVEINRAFIKRDDFMPYLRGLSEVNLELFIRMIEQANQHSNEGRLSDLDTPALIIAGEKDGFTPAWISRKMQRLIPNAQLLEVRGGSHTTPIEFPELVNLRIEKFLREQVYA